MRRAVDEPLQRHVMREVLVAIARRGPVGPDPAHVLAQRLRGREPRCAPGCAVPPGVMVPLEGGYALTIPRDERPYRASIHTRSLPREGAKDPRQGAADLREATLDRIRASRSRAVPAGEWALAMKSSFVMIFDD